MRLNTSLSPLALGSGEFSSIQNFRRAKRLLRARYGTTNLGTIVEGAFRGAFIGRFDGAERIFVAALASGAVRVYRSDDAATWTEITSNGTNQPYGDTRMTDDGLVQFAIVKDRDAKQLHADLNDDVLVFGSASNNLRAYSRFYDGWQVAPGYQTAKVTSLTSLSDIQKVGVVLQFAYVDISSSWHYPLPIYDAANTTLTPSDADITVADSGSPSATNNRVVVTFTTAVDDGDNAVIECNGNAKKLLDGASFLLGVDTAWNDFLASVKIEVGNYAGSFTAETVVWDPSASDPGTATIVSLGGAYVKLYSFDISTKSESTPCDAIRLTFKGTKAPSANQAVSVFYIAPGPDAFHANPGGTLIGLTRYNWGSHTESAGMVFEEYDTPATIYGAPDDYAKLKVPVTEDIDYTYQFTLKNPSSLTGGDSALRIYRQRPDDDDLYLVWTYRALEFDTVSAGAWSYILSGASSLLSGHLPSVEPSTRTTMPSAWNVAAPKAAAVGASNDRLLVGTTETGKAPLYISEQDQPFRFSDVNAVADGGFEYASAGVRNGLQDKVRAFGVVSGSGVGVNTIYVLGEKFVYVTGGTSTGELLSLSSLGIPGTVSPGSVAVSRSALYFLDREDQVRVVSGGGSAPISLGVVDDQTAAIPAARKPYAFGSCFGNRYYLAYTAAGDTTNSRILVFSELEGIGWESIDVPTVPAEGLASWYDPAANILKHLKFGLTGPDLKCAWYENPSATSDESGTGIPVVLTTGEMHSMASGQVLPNWFIVKRMGVACDDTASVSGTVTRTYRPGPSNTGVSTVSLDAATSEVFRYTSPPTITGTGYGWSCAVRFTATVLGGWNLFSAFLEMEPRAPRVAT